ncbi:MAG: IS110 family transposase [Desulfoarculaceae bacterium]|nr:IS110 family transposase [Desulfoarculaceae bacterium]
MTLCAGITASASKRTRFFGDPWQHRGFAAFVGVDWADKKHDVSISSGDGGKPVHQVITHTPEALNEWLLSLRQQYPDGLIALCLEQSRGALIFHLLGYDFLTLFPVNPKNLARFREAFAGSGAKVQLEDRVRARTADLVVARDRLQQEAREREGFRELRMVELKNESRGLRALPGQEVKAGE